MAYTMSSEASPRPFGVGGADRIDIDVSERTYISRKYASAVKHALELPAALPSAQDA